MASNPKPSPGADPTLVDAALDRSRRDREAAAALQAAIEEQLTRATPAPQLLHPAARGRQI